MLAGILTGLLAARTLGPEGRGELTALTIWPTTILYAGTLGLAEATAYFAASQDENRDSTFITTQTMALLLGMVVAAIGWVTLPMVLSNQSLAAQSLARVYLLLFAVPCLGSLSACAWLQGTGRIAEFNVSRSVVHVATALVMALFAIAGRSSVRNYMGAMLFGNVLTWIVAVSFSRARRAGPSAITPALIPPLLAYGARVQLGSWSAAANVRLDQLMLTSLVGPARLGMYVVAVSYAGLLTTLPTVAAMVMLPRMVVDCAAGRGAETLATWYRRVLWVTLCAGLGLWLVSRPIVPLLFGGAFSASVTLVSILVPANCILGMNQLLAVGFRGHGRPGVASRAELIGLVVTIPTLIALLPRLGAYGAAVSSLCAYSCSGVYLLIQARRTFQGLRAFCMPTEADWKLLARATRTAMAFTVRLI